MGSFVALSCKRATAKPAVLRGNLRRPGITLQVPAGAPVVAVAEGRVAHAGWERGYGSVLILDHGDRYHTIYGHLSKTGPRPGDRVSPGQVIGLAGTAGLTAHSALYFEIRWLGRPVEPETWLRRTGQGGTRR